jgi:ribokinase
MRKPEVTVVGSFAVGLTMRAPKLPIFGETMLGTDFDMGPGGKGSNQAVATARLGAHSALLALLGTDKLAGIATDLYAAEGVDTALVATRSERATGVGIIILNDKGENFIILDMGANELMDAATVDAGEARIAASDVVMTVLEIPTAAAARAMELGRRHGARTILNPAPARQLPDSIFAHVDYLTPNESELRILLGLPADDPRSSRELAGELRRRGVRNVVVTLGRTGALILTDDLDRMVPAVPVDVVDTTGAGDNFNAGFLAARLRGEGFPAALAWGNALGALSTRAAGGTTADPAGVGQLAADLLAGRHAAVAGPAS